jgi:hypothetical protein
MNRKSHDTRFPSAREDAAAARRAADSPQTRSPTYRLSFLDDEFLLRDELRPVRLQLELLKPEILLSEHEVRSTVVIFGSARIEDPEASRRRLEAAEAAARSAPDDPAYARVARIARRLFEKSRYYEEARKLARIISERCRSENLRDLVVVTGGGPGIMEAGNRGAREAGAKTVGLNIVLPHEQAPNRYITPELSFQFHYFAIRKMHFLLRAQALVAFPGGFGTLDELFETLTLVQTGKVEPIPIVLVGAEFWRRAVDFEFLVEEGVISSEDRRIFRIVETAEEAWEAIAAAAGR